MYLWLFNGQRTLYIFTTSVTQVTSIKHIMNKKSNILPDHLYKNARSN